MKSRFYLYFMYILSIAFCVWDVYLSKQTVHNLLLCRTYWNISHFTCQLGDLWQSNNTIYVYCCKNSKEICLTGSAQIFLYACFSFRLSPRLNIDRRITKIGTNDRYHVESTGLKSTHCQSKMADKNPRWQPRNSVFFYIFVS